MLAVRTLLTTLLLSAGALAASFEGIAPLGQDGIAAAREAALRDALENAGLARGATVRASTVEQAEALQVRGQPVGGYSVRQEWQGNGFYHVSIEVQPAVAGKTASPAVPPPACGADYRRKLLVTRMPVSQPVQIPDLARFPDALQDELARRMDSQGRFLAQTSALESAVALQASPGEPQWDSEWIRSLARRYGVQFVVGGVVRDAGFEGERYTLSHGNDVRPGERKLQFNIPLLNFTQAGVKATPTARRFELDLLLFDGVSGALIKRQRLAGRVESEFLQPSEMVLDPAVGTATARFFESDFGKLVGSKLDEAVQAVQAEVQCIPFTARVLQVDAGRVYLDAGASSRIAPGDRLQLYRVRPGALPVGASGAAQPPALGWAEEVAGSLTIKDVQPLFSVALPEGRPQVEVGDYVRFVGQEKKP